MTSDDTPLEVKNAAVEPTCLKSIHTTIQYHQPYWKAFENFEFPSATPKSSPQKAALSPASSSSSSSSSSTTSSTEGATSFAVFPRSSCPHMHEVKAVPADGIDHAKPCENCGSTKENWVCLTCYKVGCSRYVNGHMFEVRVSAFSFLFSSFSLSYFVPLQHHSEKKHSMVLSFSDDSPRNTWICQSFSSRLAEIFQ